MGDSMRGEEELTKLLGSKGYGKEEVAAALESLRDLGEELAAKGLSFDRPPTAAVEDWLARRFASPDAPGGGTIGAERLLRVLALYYSLVKENALAIRILAYLLPIGVLPAMAGRVESLHGPEVRGQVETVAGIPAPGSPPEAYPSATARFVTALRETLGEEMAAKALAWNVHGIPASAFAAERERFLELGSIDGWLADYHRRQVETLARHAESGELWFEQRITPAVVDFVASRQEVLAGVRRGDKILVTKIPYDPEAWLSERDPVRRRRLACHCPLAASSITGAGAEVPALWCSCSAGFAKFRFDVVFGEETEAEVLASVLAGEELCRFAVKIPESLQA